MMIGLDELPDLDRRLQDLFHVLIQSKKVSESDQYAARSFLEWVIYEEWEAGAPEIDIRPIQWSEGLEPPQRNVLIEVARAAAALVTGGKDRDKSALLQA